jgi:hypothetical protein
MFMFRGYKIYNNFSWDNSLVAIAKFYNPLYTTDVSLTCEAHLCP